MGEIVFEIRNTIILKSIGIQNTVLPKYFKKYIYFKNISVFLGYSTFYICIAQFPSCVTLISRYIELSRVFSLFVVCYK